MTHLIDKSALVAEIERRIKTNLECMFGLRNLDYYQGKVDALNDTISSINTIEVKEVDLEKEINKYISDNFFGSETMGFFAVRTKEEPNDIDMALCAKHFFELGLQTSNPLTWEDMMIIHKCYKDAMNCNLYAWQTEEGQQKIYENVLKRFKAQKGE